MNTLPRKRFLAAAWIVTLVVFLAYAPSLFQGFVNYDDPSVIQDNEAIRGVSLDNIASVFGEIRDNAWLPFYYCSFWLDHAFWGLEPGGYKLLNILLHALNAVLLLAFLRRLTGDFVLAMGAATIFAVHPVLVESVAWASGRKDVLSMTFALGGLLVFSRGLNTGRTSQLFAWPAVLFLLGVFTKATVVVFPLFAALVFWFMCQGEGTPGVTIRRRARRSCALLLFLGLVAAGIHLGVAHSQGTVGTGGEPAVHRLIGMLGVFGRYLFNLVLPVDLSVHYHQVFDGAFGATQFNGLLGLVILVVVALAFRRRLPGVTLGVLWFLVALIPFNNVLPSFSIAMADRYLYAGVPGFALLVSSLVLGARVTTQRGVIRPGGAMLVMLVALMAWQTNSRVRVWGSSETLWKDAMEKSAEATLPRLQLGDALKKQASLEKGQRRTETLGRVKRLYEEGLDRASNPVEGMQSRLKLAGLLVQMGHFADALPVFGQIRADQQKIEGALPAGAAFDLSISEASALAALGRYEQARECLGRATSGGIVSLDALNMAAVVDVMQAREQLAAAGNTVEKAVAHKLHQRGLSRYKEICADHPMHMKSRIEYVEALLGATWISNQIIRVSSEVNLLVRDFPRDSRARLLRATVNLQVDPQAAAEDLKIAITEDPYRDEPYVLLAAILRKAGRNKDAKSTLEIGMAVRPDSEVLRAELAQTYLSFGYHYLNTKDREMALAACNRALEVDSRTAEAHVLRGELHEQMATSGELDEREEKARAWENAYRDFSEALELEPGFDRASLGLARYHKYRGYAFAWEATRTIDNEDLEDRDKRKGSLRRRQMEEFLHAVGLAPGYEALGTVKELLSGYSQEIRYQAQKSLDARELQEARRLSAEATRFDPAESENHALLAEIERADGNFKEAMDAYRLALKRDPGHLRSLYELGKLLFVEEKWKASELLLEQFISRASAPDYATILQAQISVARDLLEKCRLKGGGQGVDK